MTLYARFGDVSFPFEDIYELNEILKQHPEHEIEVFNHYTYFEGDKYTPSGHIIVCEMTI